MSRSTKLPSCTAAGVLSAVALLALVPVTGLAQSSIKPSVSAESGKVVVNEADQIRQHAEALLATQDRNNWKKAARLLEEAAGLRPVESPKAIQELSLSAEMLYNLGQASRAQENLSRAAEQALGNGRVLEAAQLYLKAAYVADSRMHAIEAKAYIQSAERLAGSPHLSQDECDCITERIARASTVQQKVVNR